MDYLFKKIYSFFDKVENKVRNILSHHPIFYALLGSIATVSIWRGIWEMSDRINLDPAISLFGGILLSIITGLFVSFFIGENIIISGMKKEKRLDEKTEEEIKKEATVLDDIKKDIEYIKSKLDNLDK